MSKIKVSQSLAKSLYDYREGKECGLVIKAKWVDGIQFPSTDPMDLGNYFEFVCTGQLPRDGHVPAPKTLKNGNLPKDYERVHLQAQNFKRVMDHYGFHIYKTGVKLQTQDLGGILDILAVKDGKYCIIDTKYSGLLEDKWTDMGWNDDSIETKERLLIQAVQYKLLWREIYGTDIDFYFFVFSSKNETDFKIFHIEVDPDVYQKHRMAMNNIGLYFEQLIENGFEPNPSFKRCKNCFLKENCSHRVDYPEIKTIYYSY